MKGRGSGGHLIETIRGNGIVQNVAISGAEASSAEVGPDTSHVRLSADEACWYRIAPTSIPLTVDNGVFLPAGIPEWRPIPSGNKVWVIGTGGILNIEEA